MVVRPALAMAYMLIYVACFNDLQHTLAQSAVDFVDTSFENASPLWYEFDNEGTLQLFLVYDHERSSPNRAAGHFHFKIIGKPHAVVQLELNNLNNVWNGNAASVAPELKSAVVSEDGRAWTSIAANVSANNRVTMELTLSETGDLFVARVEPYRVSDLDRLIGTISKHASVRVTPIGKTCEGRNLEIVQIGDTDSPYRVFLRARAHPWEAGGNWVLEGLIGRLLQDDAIARRCLDKYCVYILPTTNCKMEAYVASGWLCRVSFP